MRIKLIFIFILLFSFSFFSCSSKYLGTNIQVNRIEIIDYGIYKTQPTGEILKTDIPSGGIVKPSVAKEFVKQTDQIPAVLGLSFGYRFIVKGSPEGQKTNFTLVVSHPEMVNPNNGKSFTEQRYIFKYPIEQTNLLSRHSYKFDEEWELVSGKWILKLYYKNKLLAEKSFTVYKE